MFLFNNRPHQNQHKLQKYPPLAGMAPSMKDDPSPSLPVENIRQTRSKDLGRGPLKLSKCLINNFSNDFSLFNMDGKIIMKRQVFYKNEWKNVESFDRTPQSICGNSFFTKKVIESGNRFTFVAPCLEGNIKTKFRFVIFTKPVNEQSPIYSNEFDGFINKKLIE